MSEARGQIITDAGTVSRARPLLRLEPGMVLSIDAVGRIRELERLRAAAHEIGRRDGIAEVIAQAAATLEAAVELREARLRESEDDALALALAVAERVVQARFEREPERLAEIVSGVRESMADARQVTLVAGSRAHALLEQLGVEARVRGLTLTHAASAEPWSLQMQGAAGELEFGLESQLRAVGEALRG